MKTLALILILTACSAKPPANSANKIEAGVVGTDNLSAGTGPTNEELDRFAREGRARLDAEAQPIRLSDEQLDRMGRDYARRLRTQECIRDVSRCPPPRHRYAPRADSEADRIMREMIADGQRRSLERRIEQLEAERAFERAR